MPQFPALRALKQHRIGHLQTDTAEAIVSVYETPEKDSDLPDTYTRPFPILFRSPNAITVLESFIQSDPINPLSEYTINYAHELYKSLEKNQWTDTIKNGIDTSLDTTTQDIVKSLQHGATNPSAELYNTILKQAARYNTTKTSVQNNPLNHTGTLTRNNSPYIPPLNTVDKWTLRHYSAKDPETNTKLTESLWLVYSINGYNQERPLIATNNNNNMFSIYSEDITFSNEDSTTPSYSLIASILSDTYTTNTSTLEELHPQDLHNTTTKQYLQAYITNT